LGVPVPAAIGHKVNGARSVTIGAVDGQEASYRTGARAALPLGLVVGVFGISFGVLARSAGLGPWLTVLMSATTFAGSAQFAAVAVLSTGGSLATAVLAAALLNARYVPIGASVASVLTPNRLLRLLQAQLVVDENWAIAHRGERVSGRVLLGAGVVLYTAWVGGTILGVAGGGLLKDPSRLGLDAAFPALFLALAVAQLKTRRAFAAALMGAAIALALVPVAPPGVPVIAALAACLLGLRR
jgi:4-azaleucine resistance transporter AzlC